MASVSNVPDIPRNEMSLCSCHTLSVKKALFTPEKVNIDLFQEAESTIIQLISITYRGPTPFDISKKTVKRINTGTKINAIPKILRERKLKKFQWNFSYGVGMFMILYL